MLVGNLLGFSKTQKDLVDTDLPRVQRRTVVVRDRSTQSAGANRPPSRCEVFRLPRLVRLVPRSAPPVLPGAAEMLTPLPGQLALSRRRSTDAPAFPHP